MIFSEFDDANISKILDQVAPDWSPPDADMDFKRFYAEYTVRHNIWDASYSLQASDDQGNFLAACFAAPKDAQEGLEKAVTSGRNAGLSDEEIIEALKKFMEG